MKLYDLIKKLLKENPEYRDSDKKLMWRVWAIELNTDTTVNAINYLDFLKVSTPESITRARRMVQQDFEDLRASDNVSRQRKAKQEQKGTHVYREYIFDGGVAKEV